MKKENQLTRSEMKKVFGGLLPPPSDCSTDCGNGKTASCTGTDCEANPTGCTATGANGNPIAHSCADL